MDIINETSYNIYKICKSQDIVYVNRSIWVLLSITDCIPCKMAINDFTSINFDTDYPLYHVEISKIGPDEELLLKFCNAGQFPFLCIIENGSVKRRWAGYFVDEEESFRIEQLKKILSSE